MGSGGSIEKKPPVVDLKVKTEIQTSTEATTLAAQVEQRRNQRIETGDRSPSIRLGRLLSVDEIDVIGTDLDDGKGLFLAPKTPREVHEHFLKESKDDTPKPSKPKSKPKSKSKTKSKSKSKKHKRRKSHKRGKSWAITQDQVNLAVWETLMKKDPTLKKEDYWDPELGWNREKLKEASEEASEKHAKPNKRALSPKSIKRSKRMRSRVDNLIRVHTNTRAAPEEVTENKGLGFDNLVHKMESALVFDKDQNRWSVSVSGPKHELSTFDDAYVVDETKYQSTSETSKTQRSERNHQNHYLISTFANHEIMELLDHLDHTFIWRIEDLDIQPWDGQQYGAFHEGDCYIVLSPIRDLDSPSRGDIIDWKLFFWIGKQSSVDKKAVAAMKSVELSTSFNSATGKHIPHCRETQGEESTEFLINFPGKVTYLPGGSESALRHVEDDRETFEPVFLQLKGVHDVSIHAVEMTGASLNCGDTFILQTFDVIYVWYGTDSNFWERAKGFELALKIKDCSSSRHSKKCQITYLQQRSAGPEPEAKMDPDELSFWEYLGGSHTSVKSTEEGGLDSEVKDVKELLELLSAPKSDNVKTNPVAPKSKYLSKAVLSPNASYVMDCVNEIFVWVGSKSSKPSQKAAIQLATEKINDGRPAFTPLTFMAQHTETPLFKIKFSDWDVIIMPQYREFKRYPRKQIDPIDPFAHIDSKNLHENRADWYRFLQAIPRRGANTVENFPTKRNLNSRKEPPPAPLIPPPVEFPRHEDEELFVYVVNDNELGEVSSSGVFYSDRCYVCMHLYKVKDEETVSSAATLYFWQGWDCPNVDFNIWKYELQPSVKQAVYERTHKTCGIILVQQCREPVSFLRLFQDGIIICKGRAKYAVSETGPRSSVTDFSDHPCRLFHVHGFHRDELRTIQIECISSQLNSGDAFVLLTSGKAFAWYGKHCNDTVKTALIGVLERLMEDHELNVMNEGDEDAKFWSHFQDTSKRYPEMSKAKSDMYQKRPRMFAFSSKTSEFSIKELQLWTQQDLNTSQVFMFDMSPEIFMWIGKRALHHDKALTREFAIDYVKNNPQQRSIDAYQITEIHENHETRLFISMFPGWQQNPAPVVEDPYLKTEQLFEDTGVTGRIVHYSIPEFTEPVVIERPYHHRAKSGIGISLFVDPLGVSNF